MNRLFYCEGWCYSCSGLRASWCNHSVRGCNTFSLHSSDLRDRSSPVFTLVSFAAWFIISQETSPVCSNWHLLLLIPGVCFPFAPAEISQYIAYLIQRHPKGDSINLPLTAFPLKTPSGEWRPCQDCDCAPVFRTSCSQDRQALVN